MNTTKLNKYNNDWFRQSIGASGLKKIAWYFVELSVFNAGWLPASGLKCRLLRLFGAKVGTGVVIKPYVKIKFPWKLTVGDYSWIGEQVWIDNLAPVTIGNNVCLSQGAMLLTGNHNFKKETFDLVVKPIHLNDGVWIGARSVVCPGITAASHAVLAVGSIARTNLEAYTIYSGNPAAAIKKRDIE